MMRSHSGNTDFLSLKNLIDSAERYGVPFGRFAATMENGECYWDIVDDPRRVIVTLSNLVLCAHNEYPGIPPNDLYFRIQFYEDFKENTTNFIWKLAPVHEILTENHTISLAAGAPHERLFCYSFF